MGKIEKVVSSTITEQSRGIILIYPTGHEYLMTEGEEPTISFSFRITSNATSSLFYPILSRKLIIRSQIFRF